MLIGDEARRVATNIAKLPELLVVIPASDEGRQPGGLSAGPTIIPIRRLWRPADVRGRKAADGRHRKGRDHLRGPMPRRGACSIYPPVSAAAAYLPNSHRSQRTQSPPPFARISEKRWTRREVRVGAMNGLMHRSKLRTAANITVIRIRLGVARSQLRRHISGVKTSAGEPAEVFRRSSRHHPART